MAQDQGKELAEEVVAQSADVLEIRDALNLAYYQNMSLDMVDSYREVLPEGKRSELTRRLEDALRKAQALIELSKDDSASDSRADTPEDIPAPPTADK